MDIDPMDALLGGSSSAASDLPAEAPAPEPTEGPARDPQGRFASPVPAAPVEAAPAAPAAQPLAEAPAPAAAAPLAPPAPPEGYVPISVVQELRRENKALKSSPPVPPAPAPDFDSDPAGAMAHQQQVFEQRMLNERLNSSERWARREHGAEKVDQAKTWALDRMQSDPLYYQQVMSSADPYEAVIQDWKRDQVLSSMKDGDLDAFLAWKGGNPAPQPASLAPAAPVAIPAPAAPPRSLASAPTAGAAKPGDIPVGPGAAFDKL